MSLNRRVFLASSAAVVAAHPLLSATRLEGTSGGIGLTLADVQSIYEEPPHGQSFRNFAEPRSGTTLYFDFGNDDFAQNIWVSGEMDEESAWDLIEWLCPDDVHPTHRYEILTFQGSIAYEKMQVLYSGFLKDFYPARQTLMAKYVVKPGELPVTNLLLTVVQEGRRDNATRSQEAV